MSSAQPLSPPLIPLSPQPIPSPRNPQNAGNTCYLDSILVALFAEHDGSDSLLTVQTPSPPHQALRKALRVAVNYIRCGQVLPRRAIRDVLDALIKLGWYPGSAQQDAAELYAFLLDELSAPFVPLYNNLSHGGVPDAADHTPSTERLLWLDLNGGGALTTMLNHYFFGQVRKGLRRGGSRVDAKLTRNLIPFYTPTRETGETVSARRINFRYLTVPLAINRFRSRGVRKDRAFVDVPTAISATHYVNHFASGARYTLILRSVVCHIGYSIASGHYVCYTYEPKVGWRRWNDLDDAPVKSVRGDVRLGLPENESWKEEIARDSYLLFYELVPGDGEIGWQGKGRREEMRKQVMADEQFARQSQVEEDHLAAIQEHFMKGGGALIGGEIIRPFAFWPTQ